MKSKVILRRRTLLAGLAVHGFVTQARAQVELPPTAANYFHDESTLEAQLSPDGRYVALLSVAQHKGVMLSAWDLATMSPRVLHSQEDADACNVQWVGSSRLQFSVEQRRTPQGLEPPGPGLFTIQIDGAGFRPLVERRLLQNRIRTVQEAGLSGVVATGKAPAPGAPSLGQSGMGFKQVSDAPNVQNLLADSGDTLLTWNTNLLPGSASARAEAVLAWRPTDVRAGSAIEVLQINLRNGRARVLDLPGPCLSAHADVVGQIRAVVVAAASGRSVQWRDTVDAPWRNLPGLVPEDGEDWSIRHVGNDGKLYVSARRGRDTLALWSFDVASGRWSEAPLAQSPQFDVQAQPLLRQDRVAGYRFTIDAEVTQWTDGDLRTLQEQLDKVLPRTVNRISVPQHGDAPWVLIESYSDAQPSQFLLFNRTTRKVTRLGKQRPDLDGRPMASMDMVRVRCRDGTELPVWLTRPAAAKKQSLPVLVLLPDAAFGTMQCWQWHAQAQFLAARGYVVLQPELRGTRGLGARHFQQGWQQWVTRAQTDLVDVTQWAQAQDFADGRRIAVGGAGHGAYVALLAILQQSTLFRCAVVWGAVTDLRMSVPDEPSTSPEREAAASRARLAGQRLRETTANADQVLMPLVRGLQRPLLLGHGASDSQAPLAQAEALARAAQAATPSTQWAAYPNEGHQLRALVSIIDWQDRMAGFLDRHLGA